MCGINKNMRNYIGTLREFPNIALCYRSELDDENPSLDMSNRIFRLFNCLPMFFFGDIIVSL